MTASEVIDRARLALNDQDSANYRWTNPTLLGYLDDAIQDAIARRPDLALSATGTTGTFGVITALTDTIELPDNIRCALSSFVCDKALSEDSTDTANAQQAQAHYQQYLRDIYLAL